MDVPQFVKPFGKTFQWDKMEKIDDRKQHVPQEVTDTRRGKVWKSRKTNMATEA